MSITANQVRADWVTFKSGSDEIRGYLAVPEGPHRLPAIVMAHENLGVIPHRQAMTRAFAEAGFVTMTVDLYSRIGGHPPQNYRNVEERRSMAFLAARDEQSVPDLDAGRRHLTTLAAVDRDRIGTIGYCLGGGPSLVWATQSSDLKALVLLYALPILPPDYCPGGLSRSRIEIADKVRCPTQGHFGEADEVIPLEQVRALEASLRRSPHPIEMHTYPGAGHAYQDDGHPNYHAEAARVTQQRSVEFFRRFL